MRVPRPRQFGLGRGLVFDVLSLWVTGNLWRGCLFTQEEPSLPLLKPLSDEGSRAPPAMTARVGFSFCVGRITKIFSIISLLRRKDVTSAG
jgi:hypothetical protein